MVVAQADTPAKLSPDHYRISPQTTWLRRVSAVAAIALVVIGVAIAYKHHNDNRTINTSPIAKETITVGPITVTQIDQSAELTHFDSEIVQLQQNIQSLIESAERLDAQQRIAIVLAQNTKW